MTLVTADELYDACNLDRRLYELINPRKCVGGAFVAAGGAGVRSRVQLFNQAAAVADDYGYVYLEQMWLQDIALARNFQIAVDTNGRPTVLPSIAFRDPHLSGFPWNAVRAPVIGSVRSGQGGPAPTLVIMDVARIDDDDVAYDVGWCVAPQHGITVDPGADNLQVEANFLWWEFNVRRLGRRGEVKTPGYFIQRDLQRF